MSLLSQNFTPDQTTVSFVQDFLWKGEHAAKFKNRSPRTTTNWNLFNSIVGCCEDAIVDNVDEEYNRLIQHLHVSAVKAESSKVTQKRLFPETQELIRQCRIARGADKSELTSELAKQCRKVIKEDLKERRAAVMVEATEVGINIRKAHGIFANYKT
uniref:Uncharacterized protein n=1 Tax=Angiostrongylus cantonensis TaxID=6313 RepID=A0A0K0CXM0_ANGCA